MLEVFLTNGNRWRFRITADDGRELAASSADGYDTKDAATEALMELLAAIKRHGPTPKIHYVSADWS